MAMSLSAEQLATVKASLKESGKLPVGYSLQTQISGNALDSVPLDKEDANSRSIVQPSNTNSIIVRDGVSTPDEVWDPGTEIMAAFTNNFDFFPTLSGPMKIPTEMESLILEKIFTALMKLANWFTTNQALTTPMAN